MAKRNLLFFVHGIGRHSQDWLDAPNGPVAVLDHAMTLYPDCFPAGSKFRDFVDVVSIRYDDIFDDQIKRWSDQVKDLPLAGPGDGWVEGLQKFWERANGDRKLFAECGGDCILYRGFDLLARSVRLRFNKILMGEIFRRHQESLASGETAPDVGIVAHSMGTAVAYDALYSLFTGSWFAQNDELLADETLTPEQRAHFQQLHEEIVAGGGVHNIPVRLDMLMMLANTSGLLTRWSASDVNALLKPGAATRMFYNLRHELDPVGKLKRFVIPAEWDPDAAVDIELKHLHQENVHALTHYLSHPAVHGRIFARMIGKERGFSGACQTAATRTKPREPQWTGLGGELKDKAAAKIQDLRTKLTDISVLGDDNDVLGLVKRFDAFTQRLLGDA